MKTDLNKSRAFTEHLRIVKKWFAPSYRFNLSRSGTPNGTPGNSEEIRPTVIPRPAAQEPSRAFRKMMKVTDDATRIIAVLQARIGNTEADEGGPLGKGARRRWRRARAKVGATSSWRKGIYCPLHHFTGS